MKKIYSLLVFILVSITLVAQSGSIEGIVRDQNTGEEVIGASVYLKGTTTGSSTDLDGNFRITNVPPGSYTLVASFISYALVEIENVVVEKNKTVVHNIEMTEASEQLDDITVVAKRRTDTEMSMISSIKNSSLVISGVSKQQIERSPDRDAAEVVRRVPGITIVDNRFIIVRGLDKRYNTVWVNGATTPSSESDARAFSFDAIPSGMLSRLTVYKTPAPELPADFAGANVGIETKGVPDKDGVTVSVSGGINGGTTFEQFKTYEGGNTDWLGFDDGTRELPSAWPTTEEYEAVRGQITDEGWRTIEGWSRSFNKIWETESVESARPDMGFSIASTKRFDLKKEHSSIGNITSISYSNSNDYTQNVKGRYFKDSINQALDTFRLAYDDAYENKVKIGVMHNWSYELSSDHSFEFRNLYNHIGKKTTITRDILDFYHEAGAKYKSTEMSFMSRNTYSGQLGGKHKFSDGTAKLNWTLGYSYADKDEPDIRRTQQRLDNNEESLNYGEYYHLINPSVSPNTFGRLFIDMKEDVLVFSSNFEKDFVFGSFRPKLKAGVFYEKKSREFNIRNIGVVQGRSFDFKGIVFLPIDSVFLDSNIVADGGIVYEEKTSAEDSYDAESELFAAYVSMKLPLTSLLTIYGGVRMEKNRQELSGFQDEVDPNDLNPIIEPNTERDTLNFFPSVNIAYNVGVKSLLRLAYGLTINRPEFRELSQVSFYDFYQNATIHGNDTLKNAYIHNFDLRYEWYPTPSEIVTFGAFYKKFVDPIELSLYPASSSEWDFFAKNTEKATSIGLEIDAKKSFANLAERTGFLRRLRHFSLSFNAAWIMSEVHQDEAYLRDNVRPMQGQSPYIVNTGVYYQNDETKWMASVLYNVIGERIVIVGTKEVPHTYEMPHDLLDFSVSKQIGEHLKIKVGVKDLLNQDVEYKQTFEFLQDANGDGEIDGTVEQEKIVETYNPGRRFNFSVSYRF